MATGVNKVILVGNLGADPEIKHTPSGAAVCELRLATNEAWTDKAGAKQERTEWHKVVAWNKLAELCGKHLRKGRQIYVEGKLQTRQWADKDGNKRYTTEVLAQTVQFLGGRGDGGGEQGGYGAPQEDQGGGYGAGYNGPSAGPDDDIPF